MQQPDYYEPPPPDSYIPYAAIDPNYGSSSSPSGSGTGSGSSGSSSGSDSSGSNGSSGSNRNDQFPSNNGSPNDSGSNGSGSSSDSGSSPNGSAGGSNGSNGGKGPTGGTHSGHGSGSATITLSGSGSANGGGSAKTATGIFASATTSGYLAPKITSTVFSVNKTNADQNPNSLDHNQSLPVTMITAIALFAVIAILAIALFVRYRAKKPADNLAASGTLTKSTSSLPFSSRQKVSDYVIDDDMLYNGALAGSGTSGLQSSKNPIRAWRLRKDYKTPDSTLTRNKVRSSVFGDSIRSSIMSLLNRNSKHASNADVRDLYAVDNDLIDDQHSAYTESLNGDLRHSEYSNFSSVYNTFESDKSQQLIEENVPSQEVEYEDMSILSDPKKDRRKGRFELKESLKGPAEGLEKLSNMTSFEDIYEAAAAVVAANSVSIPEPAVSNQEKLILPVERKDGENYPREVNPTFSVDSAINSSKGIESRSAFGKPTTTENISRSPLMKTNTSPEEQQNENLSILDYSPVSLLLSENDSHFGDFNQAKNLSKLSQEEIIMNEEVAAAHALIKSKQRKRYNPNDQFKREKIELQPYIVEIDEPNLKTYVPPPTNTHVVVRGFRSSLPDELTLEVGDIVGIERTFQDGWARGQVVSRRDKRGLFPVTVLTKQKYGPSRSVNDGKFVKRNSDSSDKSVEIVYLVQIPERSDSVVAFESAVENRVKYVGVSDLKSQWENRNRK